MENDNDIQTCVPTAKFWRVRPDSTLELDTLEAKKLWLARGIQQNDKNEAIADSGNLLLNVRRMAKAKAQKKPSNPGMPMAQLAAGIFDPFKKFSIVETTKIGHAKNQYTCSFTSNIFSEATWNAYNPERNGIALGFEALDKTIAAEREQHRLRLSDYETELRNGEDFQIGYISEQDVLQATFQAKADFGTDFRSVRYVDDLVNEREKVWDSLAEQVVESIAKNEITEEYTKKMLEALTDARFVKHADWRYEHESRLIEYSEVDAGGIPLKFEPTELTDIALGQKITVERAQEIREFCDATGLRHVRIWHLDHDAKSLNLRPLTMSEFEAEQNHWASKLTSNANLKK